MTDIQKQLAEALPPLPEPEGTMPNYRVVGPAGEGGNLFNSRGGDLIQRGRIPSGQFTAAQMRAYALQALAAHRQQEARGPKKFGVPQALAGIARVETWTPSEQPYAELPLADDARALIKEAAAEILGSRATVASMFGFGAGAAWAIHALQPDAAHGIKGE